MFRPVPAPPQPPVVASEACAPFHDLERFESTIHSQGGEDGVLQRIFELIGPGHRTFVEFGAWDGVHLSNTAYLRLEHGWDGLLMEGSDRAAPPVKREFVHAGNIEALLDRYAVPERFDLLSIDIDGNDYWVWKALERYRPRVVVVEYNALFGYHVAKVMKYNERHEWDETAYHGASLAAFQKLGHEKGYALVYTDTWTPNAFFIDRSELPPDFQERSIEAIARGVWSEEPAGTAHRDWVEV